MTDAKNEADSGASHSDAVLEALPCPFCGKPVDFEHIDTLLPSDTGWHDGSDGFRTYHRFDAVPKEQWCWDMNCPEPAGGCGAKISGDSKAEVLAKWNRRASNANMRGATPEGGASLSMDGFGGCRPGERIKT